MKVVKMTYGNEAKQIRVFYSSRTAAKKAEKEISKVSGVAGVTIAELDIPKGKAEFIDWLNNQFAG